MTLENATTLLKIIVKGAGIIGACSLRARLDNRPQVRPVGKPDSRFTT